MKIIVVSGGFDPIHSGHISYLKSAKSIGDKLVVLLNSDKWLANKKDKYFMPFEERKCILENLSMVDDVYNFVDDEIGSCINGLEKLKKLYPKDEIIFCNGGDRNKENIPEMNQFQREILGEKDQNLYLKFFSYNLISRLLILF